MMISVRDDEVSDTRDGAQGTEADPIKIMAGKLVTIVSFNKILNPDT